jgi:aryl-alcohol dehydrogenase-like predicted oxidoreductase
MGGFEWLKKRWLQEDRLQKVNKLAALAEKLDTRLAALAIAWTIKNPNVTTAILGATKKEQLLENLKALDVLPKLTPDVLEEIEGILQNKPYFDLA